MFAARNQLLTGKKGISLSSAAGAGTVTLDPAVKCIVGFWHGFNNGGLAQPAGVVGGSTMTCLYWATTFNNIGWYFYGGIWVLMNPPTGSVSITGIQEFMAFKGVSNYGSVSSAGGSSSPLAHTVACSPGNVVAQMFGQSQLGNGDPPISNYNQTKVFANEFGSSGLSGGYALATGSSVAFSATSTPLAGSNQGEPYIGLGVPLIAA